MGAGHGRGWAFGESIGSMRGFETRMEELRIGLGCRAAEVQVRVRDGGELGVTGGLLGG